MNCSDIIKSFTHVRRKTQDECCKMGIPKESSIGVSTADIRRLARETGRSDELAFELWETGYHEARLLAVLLLKRSS